MADTLFLDGGPRRGRHVALHGSAPPIYRIALAPSLREQLARFDAGPSDGTLDPITYGNYTPMYDPLGMPYQTAAGHPIYRWRGTE